MVAPAQVALLIERTVGSPGTCDPMHVEALVSAATDLATSVGPKATLDALHRVQMALDAIDSELWSGDRDQVIDLRETRSVLDELRPVIHRAEVRVADLHSAMNGR